MERINEIIIELKEKNYQSFDEFYNLTKKTVFFTIAAIIKNATIVDDLMQDTYIKFLNNIDKCDINNNVQAYLATIARNIAINKYNIRKKEVFDDEYLHSMAEDKVSHDIDLGIINLLEGIEKEIVSLHIINNLKFKEIASILSKPLGTVLWHYNKGIKKLKKKVGEK